MSYVIAAPELMESAATDLAAIGSGLNEANAAAAPTLTVVPAAADEVSASIAQLFSGYGREYQNLAGQAAEFHAQFVRALTAAGGAYASAEAANASLLQPLAAGSVGSAAAASPGQIGNVLNSTSFALSQFIKLLFGPDAFSLILNLLYLPLFPLALLFVLFLLSNGGLP